uniref:RNA helicase n=1 Tax=Romanomermis culicivorax TaxID=13658 RepID=A0A915JW29_ROMCU
MDEASGAHDKGRGIKIAQLKGCIIHKPQWRQRILLKYGLEHGRPLTKKEDREADSDLFKYEKLLLRSKFHIITLLGDVCQLGPCITSKKVEELGYGQTLFECLHNMHLLYALHNEQYPMHPEIGSLTPSKPIDVMFQHFPHLYIHSSDLFIRIEHTKQDYRRLNKCSITLSILISVNLPDLKDDLTEVQKLVSAYNNESDNNMDDSDIIK